MCWAASGLSLLGGGFRTATRVVAAAPGGEGRRTRGLCVRERNSSSRCCCKTACCWCASRSGEGTTRSGAAEATAVRAGLDAAVTVCRSDWRRCVCGGEIGGVDGGVAHRGGEAKSGSEWSVISESTNKPEVDALKASAVNEAKGVILWFLKREHGDFTEGVAAVAGGERGNEDGDPGSVEEGKGEFPFVGGGSCDMGNKTARVGFFSRASANAKSFKAEKIFFSSFSKS